MSLTKKNIHIYTVSCLANQLSKYVRWCMHANALQTSHSCKIYNFWMPLNKQLLLCDDIHINTMFYHAYFNSTTAANDLMYDTS